MAKKPTDKPNMTPITADDPEAKSADVVTANLEKLKALFPEAVSEDGVNVDVLNQLIGRTVTDADEKYGLNWHGKRKARQLALTPSTGTLRPCPEESVDWDTTQNLFIEGDNLEVLKLLQKSYANKVKLIYIDPPYNRGGDFVYPDNYQDSMRNYLELTGQVDDAGRQLTSNTEASGRFHTTWLNMMYPRLKLARSLLRDDGAIFVSIDDSEIDSLRAALKDLFGEENFVAQLVVQTNPRGRTLDRYVAKTFEYVVVFTKSTDNDSLYQIPKSESALAQYNKEDEGGKYRELELRNRNPVFDRTNRPNLWFPLYINPDDDTVALTKSGTHHVEALPRNSKDEDGCWTWSRKKVEENNHLLVGRQARTGAWRVFRKDYIPPDGATTKEKSLWLEKNLNHENGKEELGRLFEKTPFDFPKSTALIQKILALGTVTNRHDIVLDFFAGSGTTAHAVMAQNAVDGGDRRFVLVQLPEPLDPENKDQTVGSECCDKLGKPRNIAELTKERLRRAAAGVRNEYPLFKGDTGFRAFQLQTSNIRAWNPDPDDLEGTLHEHTEHLAAGRSESDVHAVGAGTLFACLAESISRDDVEALAQAIIDWHKELAPEGETTIVFRDSGFADDVAKSNLAAILVQAGFDDTRIRSL